MSFIVGMVIGSLAGFCGISIANRKYLRAIIFFVFGLTILVVYYMKLII